VANYRQCSCTARLRDDGTCPFGCERFAAEKRANRKAIKAQLEHQHREEHAVIVPAKSLRPVMRRVFGETVEREEQAGLIRRPRSHRKGER
jgi:hypothetical protein